ncbi:helix-turn-helix domain-containing protein [Saccharopolyspora sp. 6T]|uniref:PucR family transcriptional regulator n=1 Tax=Saccharopolyspora sp. 6T TaxID=2877238 RepID=UPI001CD2DA1E|nr:helix-turn-helix domain-containing protein [Saccharopolyspora sp. 6T]MCA1188755.1 helix-turn-helix domain-containing protein [Saccharopolyspora sp. 6T]
MFESRDEKGILRLAMSSVPELGAFHASAAFLLSSGELVAVPSAGHEASSVLADQLAALRGEDGPVLGSEANWAWAFGLRSPDGLTGYLVLTGEHAPAPSELSLFHVLAQHTAAALANASFLYERDHARQLSRLSEDLATMNQHLKTTVDDLQRRATIHETFTRITATNGDTADIAAALHTLTGRPVAIEDRFGNLLSWAGPAESHPYSAPYGRREETLRQASARNGVARNRDRLAILAQPRHEILGVIALIDPEPTVDPHVAYAMEHAAMALALVLTHARNLAETELRLRRDLVEDLVAGVEDDSVFARSEAVGHNLHGPHYALAVQWRDASADDVVASAVQRAAKKLGMSGLVSRRSGAVVLFNSGRPDGKGFYHALAGELGDECGAIGVGGRCDAPAEFARSYREALRALRIRQESRERCGTTFFDEIGLYRILGQGEGGANVETFVREWIGRLLDYDRTHRADLVNTLSHYLDRGGNYNATAMALVIHRSTLRYRLRRIREISGIDLSDVDNRLNMHVATRAWRVLDTPS